MKIRYLLTVILTILTLAAGPAFAQNESYEETESTEVEKASSGSSSDRRPISLGVLFGYGAYLGEGDLNPFGLGLGLRGGYTLDMGLFLGAQFLYFLGESEDIPGGETSFNVMTIGIEGGYDIDIDPIIVRPSVVLGLSITSVDAPDVMGISMDASSEDFYLGPGASVIYPIDMFFIGADIRFDIIFYDETETGMTIMLNGGVNL